MLNRKTDIPEDDIRKHGPQVLDMLLKDRTSNKNIIWATDDYRSYGFSYDDQITADSVTGFYRNIIKPRTEKTKEQQCVRVREKAEVFTPAWVCNKQNNLIDNEWFGRDNVFNLENEKGWVSVAECIRFPTETGKTWEDYLTEPRMEITCGEAPYLASRYDAVSGKAIEVPMRIGLLDRKLRILSENVDVEEDWIGWAHKAFKSIYGYDWHGDNVLLSRENLLCTFIDYYMAKFHKAPTEDMLLSVSFILSWNIWQMDGLKFVIPDSCRGKGNHEMQQSLLDLQSENPTCDGCLKGNPHLHTGLYCKVMDWETDEELKFISLIDGRGENA